MLNILWTTIWSRLFHQTYLLSCPHPYILYFCYTESFPVHQKCCAILCLTVLKILLSLFKISFPHWQSGELNFLFKTLFQNHSAGNLCRLSTNSNKFHPFYHYFTLYFILVPIILHGNYYISLPPTEWLSLSHFMESFIYMSRFVLRICKPLFHLLFLVALWALYTRFPDKEKDWLGELQLAWVYKANKHQSDQIFVVV